MCSCVCVCGRRRDTQTVVIKVPPIPIAVLPSLSSLFIVSHFQLPPLLLSCCFFLPVPLPALLIEPFSTLCLQCLLISSSKPQIHCSICRESLQIMRLLDWSRCFQCSNENRRSVFFYSKWPIWLALFFLAKEELILTFADTETLLIENIIENNKYIELVESHSSPLSLTHTHTHTHRLFAAVAAVYECLSPDVNLSSDNR